MSIELFTAVYVPNFDKENTELPGMVVVSYAGREILSVPVDEPPEDWDDRTASENDLIAAALHNVIARLLLLLDADEENDKADASDTPQASEKSGSLYGDCGHCGDPLHEGSFACRRCGALTFHRR